MVQFLLSCFFFFLLLHRYIWSIGFSDLRKNIFACLLNVQNNKFIKLWSRMFSEARDTFAIIELDGEAPLET